MCFNQTGDIPSRNGNSLKLVDKFSFLGNSVSSIETDINTRLAKAFTAINRLSVVWNSDLTNKIKRSFFQAAVVSILLYVYTTWTLTKWMEEKAWRQLHKNAASNIEQVVEAAPLKQQLYDHLPSITKTIKVRRTRHVGHYWRSRDKLISNILLWTPSHGRAKAWKPPRTYIQQLGAYTGYSLEDLLGVMDDKDGWRERVREIRTGSVTWWWWWWHLTVCKQKTVLILNWFVWNRTFYMYKKGFCIK